MIVRSTFVIILNFILFYNGRTFILTDDNEGKYASLSPKDEEFPEEYLSRTQSTDTILRWSNGAYTWLMSQPCDRQNFTSEKTCALLKDIPKSDFRIYSFNPNNGGRYRIRFPDSANNRTVRYYDGVLVLDRSVFGILFLFVAIRLIFLTLMFDKKSRTGNFIKPD